MESLMSPDLGSGSPIRVGMGMRKSASLKRYLIAYEWTFFPQGWDLWNIIQPGVLVSAAFRIFFLSWALVSQEESVSFSLPSCACVKAGISHSIRVAVTVHGVSPWMFIILCVDHALLHAKSHKGNSAHLMFTAPAGWVQRVFPNSLSSRTSGRTTVTAVRPQPREIFGNRNQVSSFIIQHSLHHTLLSSFCIMVKKGTDQRANMIKSFFKKKHWKLLCGLQHIEQVESWGSLESRQRLLILRNSLCLFIDPYLPVLFWRNFAPMLLFRERKKSERKDNTKKKKKAGGWLGQWGRMRCFGVSLEPVSLWRELQALPDNHELWKASRRWQRIFVTCLISCVIGFFPFRGQCLEVGGTQLDRGCPFAWCGHFVTWHATSLHTGPVAVHLVPRGYCESGMQGITRG